MIFCIIASLCFITQAPCFPASFCKSVFNDYKEVFLDTKKNIVEKPKKASLIFSGNSSSSCWSLLSTYLSGIGLMTYCAWKNPKLDDYRNCYLNHLHQISMVSKECRNPEADSYLQVVSFHLNQKTLHHISLGVFSLLWISDYSKYNSLFENQCKYLSDRSYLLFYKRIFDIGFMGNWLNLEKKMDNYDVNENFFK